MAESSRLVGGGSWKFDPYKIFREICFVANCRTSYTLRINLIFSIKGSLNSQIPRKISVENSNLERVDFQIFLYPKLLNESNNQSPPINAENFHHCSLSARIVKKAKSKKMLFQVAKRCVECKVSNQELFACMRKFGVWAMSLSSSFLKPYFIKTQTIHNLSHELYMVNLQPNEKLVNCRIAICMLFSSDVICIIIILNYFTDA